jgi:hypothetical protein
MVVQGFKLRAFAGQTFYHLSHSTSPMQEIFSCERIKPLILHIAWLVERQDSNPRLLDSKG